MEVAQQLFTDGQEVALLVMIQTMHPAVIYFDPKITFMERWWYRVTKRIDLERDNYSYRGTGYIGERCRRLWDIGCAKTAIVFDRLVGKNHNRRKPKSLAYILESLGIEHDKAYGKYLPRPYSGDVLIFRAGKQLRGLLADWHLGWKDIVHANLNIFEVPAHQQNLLIEPNVRLLAEELTARLAAAQEEREIKAGPQGRNQYDKVEV
jgi:thioesterase domain-containing protein